MEQNFSKQPFEYRRGFLEGLKTEKENAEKYKIAWFMVGFFLGIVLTVISIFLF